MTKDELNELLDDCPILYHMAEQESWSSIRQIGLLSTTALLDLYEISGAERHAIESQRRPKSIILEQAGPGRAVIRDQFPLDDKGLSRCLQDGLSPSDWYRELNGKVFFWLTKDRLLRLLKAGNYRTQAHDVLELRAREIVEAYAERIWLCPMNSGCTKPFPHPRGRATFKRISEYPYAEWRKRRRRGERVVELAIDYAVPDIIGFVRRVVRMAGGKEIATLFEAS